MFQLTGKTTDKIYILQKNRIYTIGREGADITINTKTISRNQAVVNVKDHYVVLADCNSSNGTQVNQRSITPNKEYNITPGTNITFGIYTEFVLENFKMNATTSNLSREEKETFDNITTNLNIEVVNKWKPDLTHIFVSRNFVTTKIICALIKKQHIISTDFLLALEMRVINSLPMPCEQDFLVHSFGRHGNMTINCNIDRTKLFENRTAIFCEEEDRKKYGILIELCGGRSKSLYDYPKIKEDFFKDDKYIVTCFKYPGPLKERIVQLQTLLKRAGKRMIPPPEICHAIITASIEHFCNPIYKNEMLLKGCPPKHTGDVVVPDTQSSRQSLVDDDIMSVTTSMQGEDRSCNSDILVNTCSELPEILTRGKNAKLGIDVTNSVEEEEFSNMPVPGKANGTKTCIRSETNIIGNTSSALPEISTRGPVTKPEHHSVNIKTETLDEESFNYSFEPPEEERQQVLGEANDTKSCIESVLGDLATEETNIIVNTGSVLPEISARGLVTEPGHHGVSIKTENLQEESSEHSHESPEKRQQVHGKANDTKRCIGSSLGNLPSEETNIIVNTGPILPEISLTKPEHYGKNIKKRNREEESSTHSFEPSEKRHQVIGEPNDSFQRPKDTRIPSSTTKPMDSFSNKIEVVPKPEKKLSLKRSKRKGPLLESSCKTSVKKPVNFQTEISAHLSSNFHLHENSTFLNSNLTKPVIGWLSSGSRKDAIKNKCVAFDKTEPTPLHEESEFAKIFMQSKMNISKVATMPENKNTNTMAKTLCLKRKNAVKKIFHPNDMFVIPDSVPTTAKSLQKPEYILKKRKRNSLKSSSMNQSHNKTFCKQKVASFSRDPITASRTC